MGHESYPAHTALRIPRPDPPRKGAANLRDERVTFSVVASPIGELLLTWDGRTLTGLYLESHKRGPVPDGHWRRDDAAATRVAEQLAAYFAGERRRFDVPTAPRGSEFQRRVWEALATIPFGATISYAELARLVGAPGSARAVGAAVGRNPISIVVPCHRVVGSDGGLTGYAGGLERKRWLLEHERAVADR
jgi:methylated-DNA-[protein]-cysteine S-methyltransferase